MMENFTSNSALILTISIPKAGAAGPAAEEAAPAAAEAVRALA